jgi:2-keto-4-pentenoate hydratase/2-oxohepta-3-ene-1,7-dioic acid hydratase in catechol pathway
MKLGRISLPGPDGPEARLVLVLPQEGRAIDLATAERQRLERRGAAPEAARRLARALFPGSMAAAIALGDEFLEGAARAAAAEGGDASLPLEGLRWLPAIDPPLMRDCLAFEEHMRNASARLGREVPPVFYQIPIYYKGNPLSLIGHEWEVPWPGYTQAMDYELELGFVVGRAGRDLTPEEARGLIFGVTIFNDFSARDIQGQEMGGNLGPAKGKDFATAVGPWIVTADELDLLSLEMVARVNGQEWSRGSSGTIMWRPEELLAYISWGETLQPGELVGSGTVGRGCGLELGRFLNPGDVVELEVAGIGVLRNRLGQPQPVRWRPSPRQPAA